MTLRILARLCRVSPSTASRALSGHPNVRSQVRLRIKATALKHGYRRNRLVSEVMAQVRGARTQHFVGNLAVVHVPSRQQPELLPMQRRIIEGAEERARELGFQIGVFTLGGGARGLAPLARVLRARGVMGIIFLPSISHGVTAGFKAEEFAIVQIDYESPTVLQHTISLDHHLTLVGALTRLRRLGYRRIGLFIENHKDDRLVNKWSAAFRSYQENQGGIGSVPVLKVDTMDRMRFNAWREAHEPDLVIGHVDQALSWLKRAGVGVPQDISFFNLNWNERTYPCAGLDLRPELHGRVAVETVAAQAQRSERGRPSDPRTVTFNGRWVDGPTVRARRSSG